METLCFIFGPEGIALAATIGFLFAAVQPGRVKTYNESVRTAVTNAVREGLDNNEFKKAVNDIQDFQDQLQNITVLSGDLGKDDFKAITVSDGMPVLVPVPVC